LPTNSCKHRTAISPGLRGDGSAEQLRRWIGKVEVPGFRSRSRTASATLAYGGRLTGKGRDADGRIRNGYYCRRQTRARMPNMWLRCAATVHTVPRRCATLCHCCTFHDVAVTSRSSSCCFLAATCTTCGRQSNVGSCQCLQHRRLCHPHQPGVGHSQPPCESCCPLRRRRRPSSANRPTARGWRPRAQAPAPRAPATTPPPARPSEPCQPHHYLKAQKSVPEQAINRASHPKGRS
jgi:hypothetical protein